ncbi:PSD1 and planctomycete cytochrome C domain-containing protein [Planctomycetaceae bacterium]|nr:PSD1 and planctomycete cytochrome C domain-containing protein [Planctomycetaceae bacterium]MDC0273597.1 PSD1 and planctomycete cytochrome C domain-containing protein [Planctomycetaceae bacterium]
MPIRILFHIAIVCGCFALVTITDAKLLAEDKPTPAAPLTQPDAERLFALKIAPLLKSKCLACHGEKREDLKGDFDVSSLAGLLKGGESGDPSLVPGEPAKSTLFSAINWDGYEMPPKENDRLTEDQIELVRQWIVAGAPWPSDTKQSELRKAEWSIESNEDGLIVKTSGGLADEWTYRRYDPADLWAFQPVKPPVAPNGQHPIDWFLTQKLNAVGFAPTEEADPRTLIRRASFDLLGLPPSPEETEAFVKSYRKNPEQTWKQLINRLLASPHYGERWGQHWLDVVRYADTGGYSNDYERSNMWRYRDYVIRSLNADKPYDQFIVEQLAGDELADESVRKRKEGNEKAVRQTRLKGDYSAEESEWLTATGFLRMGPWDNAMVKAPEARQIYLDDLVNAVGQTFLSTTMRCFKCHDHKFDPLPTRDYYRMYAAFAGTQMAERPAPFLPSENLKDFEEGKKHVEKMLAYAVTEKNKLVNKRETAARKWFEEHDLKYLPENERKSLPDEEKPPRHVGLDHIEQGQLKVREQDERIWTRRLERYEPMVQSVYNGSDAQVKATYARKLRIKNNIDFSQRPQSTIFTGGSLEAPGAEVQPGVLSPVGLTVPQSKLEDPYRVPNDLDGRRLAVARWIAHPENSLTTRSIVNRVWQHHFVNPLAGNPNNFGAKGNKPTHPELLDWLAHNFVEEGWKLKGLHRLLMTSHAYRQANTHPQMKELLTQDSSNHLLAYFPPRRLTAEEIRDNLLMATGELNRTVGGLPVMPEINMEVALEPRMIQFSLAPAYQPSPTPEQRNRRTVYAYRVRGQADPFLELFNQPNPNESCEVRDSAAVSPQVFTLLNSDVMTDRSIALAEKVQEETDQADQQIKRVFQRVLGRSPAAQEQIRMLAYVEKMREYHQQVTPEPSLYPSQITRSLVEELSGEPFEYEEILPVFENYQPDSKPNQVSAETRALADFCLLLFNSNEFMYVY